MSFSILERAEECNQLQLKLKLETESKKKLAVKADEFEKKMIEIEKQQVLKKGNKKAEELAQMYEERLSHLEQDFSIQKAALQKMIEDLCLKIGLVNKSQRW